LLASGAAGAETPAAPKPAYDARPLARRVWQVTDLVLERHVNPPARQQMLLAGLNALLREDQEVGSRNLGARVSRVTTEEQFAALLAEVWPGGEGSRVEERENSLLHGLLGGEEKGRGEVGYLTPFEVHIDGVDSGNRYIGTGIQIRRDEKEGYAQIVVPFAGGPARKAGARPGDLIVEIEGASTRDWTLMQVVKKLQGEEGVPVRFTVRQPNEKQTRVLEMVRGVIPFASVLGWRRVNDEGWSFRIDPREGIGYLRIAGLKASTPLELRKIEPLVRAEKVRALVLDMRFTEGSEMSHAALVADAFLDGGLMWRVRDRAGRVQEYRADRDCLFRDWPLAVLVGEHTGGVGAAVAAALQDNGRAVIVGEPTRRKGMVTSLLPLPGGAAVRIPTGTLERSGRPPRPGQPPVADRFLRPGGVQPDRAVTMDPDLIPALGEWSRQQESPEPPAPDVKPPEDRQLAGAVAVLRDALAKLDSGKKDKENR
jgi:carboxyl-terminal processing protease